jgi:hypothetical protein
MLRGFIVRRTLRHIDRKGTGNSGDDSTGMSKTPALRARVLLISALAAGSTTVQRAQAGDWSG